jgi:hypothetical protein
LLRSASACRPTSLSPPSRATSAGGGRAIPLFQLSRKGDGTLRFDPAGRTGGWSRASTMASEWEIGPVRHWLPGERLAFGWRLPSFKADQATEVDVRFEAVGAETRVTVEHRGWDASRKSMLARHGFELMLFQRRLGEFWRDC